MAKRFENKKLNKNDHEQVDKVANVARKVFEVSISCFAIVGVVKSVPWKKIPTIVAKAAKAIRKG